VRELYTTIIQGLLKENKLLARHSLYKPAGGFKSLSFGAARLHAMVF
jgi:hypothetical protein